MTDSKTTYLVVMDGGIVQDVLSNDGTITNYDVFDWDDFNDDPVQYWEDAGPEWQAFLLSTAPILYSECLEKVTSQLAKEQKIRASIPFMDVPAV